MSTKKYDNFIASKQRRAECVGFEPLPITAPLFPWQKQIVEWAIRKGRAALFEDCGLGKTAQRQDDGRESRDVGLAPSEGRCGDDATDGTGEGLANPIRDLCGGGGASAEQNRCGESPDGCQRSAQPTLGGNLNGPAGRMDYAELCRTTDNRTDELRLLGNGVVPACAALAFRTLAAELT